ncbi:FYVE zinc finger [Teladorsagia circumcincta]|uniref:FYVE zinc finger n=1 Tax=Teladorsagia circumcincta TaxID=45464 RepID=A0A2G9UHG9_TELCI|nr:FYVE zinc finger [Teladorsagia circumcincta]
MSTFNSPELLSGHFEEAHNQVGPFAYTHAVLENSLIANPNFENSLPPRSPVTQRMLEFEKENGQLKRFAENGQQERAEIMAKLKQLSGQIRTLTDENEGNKVEKEVLKKELAECKSDKEKMEKEMDVLHKALDQRSSEIIRSLTSELEDTRQLLVTCQKDLEDAKSDSCQKGKRVEELHGKVEANLAELASCREKIAQLEETVRVSAREIDDSHAMNESNLKKLTQLSDKLEQNSIITSKDQELFSLREELERAHIETEKLKSQNESRAAESDSLAKQLLALQENTKELMDRKDALVGKANEQEKQFREEKKSAADKLKKVEHQKEALERRLREAEDDVNRKAERFVEMEKEIEDDRRIANERINKLKEIVRLKEASVLEARKQLEELSTQLSDKNRLLREKEHQIEESRRKIEESVNHIAEAEAKARKLLTADLTSKEQALRDAVNEANEKEEHWKRKREEFEQQLERNQERNEELLSTTKQLQLSLEKEKNENASLQTKTAQLDLSLSEALRRVSELDAEVEELRKTSDTLAQTVKTQKEQLAEEKIRHEATQKKYEEETILLRSVENALADAKIELDSAQKNFESRQAELESSVQQLETDKANLVSDREAKEEEIRHLVGSSERLQDELKSKSMELEQFHERMAKFESEIADERRKLEALEVERQGAVEECTLLRVQQVESSKLQARCAQFEQLSKDIQFSKDRELSMKDAEIERLTTNMAEIESVAVTKESKLSEEISSLKRSIKAIQSELDDQIRISTDAVKTAEEMTTANMELSKKISSWEEEKNALIERCLNTESDLDFERERAMENKRRFDEALSAMHELGRANQSLQMDISKHSSRTWLDDSAAVNCTTCGKLFSLTVRKHHCRVCGLIFCGPCSSKTTQIASHKNPVRVCDNCFTEVQNR